MLEEQIVTVTRLEMGTGWVLFVPNPDRPPPPEALPAVLHGSVAEWVRQNSIITVRDTLPVIQNGNTVGIHVWFD
jgi:hypothetical protein